MESGHLFPATGQQVSGSLHSQVN